MRKLVMDAQGRLRNGVWILLFLAMIAVTRVMHAPLNAWIKHAGLHDAWREPLPALLVLLATWACMRLRRQRMADAGLAPDLRFVRQFVAGSALGVGMLAIVALALAAIGAVSFEPDPARSVTLLVQGLHAFFWAALLEELLFRGFVLQRLIDGLGAPSAIGGMALLFAAAHLTNPEMEGAVGLVGAVDTGLAAVMLGLAYVRTRSLALPLGLHLGWNWMQGSVLGFNVSGFDHTGWWVPTLDTGAAWLTGGGVGVEGSVLSLVVTMAVIGGLLAWRGAVPALAPPRVALA